MQEIMVVGAGQMGAGIAQVAARAGYRVLLNDVKEEFVQKGLGVIRKNLERDVAKGRLTAVEMEGTVARLVPSVSLGDAAGVSLAVEAATENMTVKTAVFRELDRVLPGQAVLASNTSSLPITELAAVTGRPDRVIGMHFMNPVPVMQLVEVIGGLATSQATCDLVVEAAVRMGKTPVVVKDAPGFVANRVLMPMINEAVFAVWEGTATPEAVDAIMKMGANHPMGPLALADLIGLDTCLAIMEVLYRGFGDPKYRPCPLLRQYVAAGWLGRKSGRGFYSYQS
ncbi:MAG: 3-hydroxybutyryl-CoA dehydrogenase [Peptococcaceae bacterium]|nr:3-hydroxybutyryl-CoA dehydrogenase [Peptococcaceae bacterium]